MVDSKPNRWLFIFINKIISMQHNDHVKDNLRILKTELSNSPTESREISRLIWRLRGWNTWKITEKIVQLALEDLDYFKSILEKVLSNYN